MKELLEAGVHFGHQTRRWNQKKKGAARGGGALPPRPPPLEPEDEGVYLRRTQWDSHYRSAKNPKNVSRSEPLCQRDDQPGAHHSLCGHKAPGPGSCCGGMSPLRDVLCQSSMARRNAYELDHFAKVH